jgi:tetratricopeptide (TPR) repeat protein
MAELPASFYLRLGDLYEKRADQIEKSITDPAVLAVKPVPAAEVARFTQVVRDLRAKAGDGFVAYARAEILTDDTVYGEALWHGIDLYDKSGDLPRLIGALEIFAAERPTDKLAPDALLRLGTAYQAAGMFDKAIATFQRNMFRYPKSLAASKSAVPLAQAYLARGPKDFPDAEKVLLGVVDDNDFVDPSAEEFHQALFELAQLYYRIGRYEDAIARVEEMMQRYPADDQLPRLTYLMADSYRKSASLLDVRLATAGPGASEAAEALAAKRDRLKRAGELFDKVVTFYKSAPPATDLDKLYQKLGYLYRADCAYDLGQYQIAIQLYEEAAFRYQSDPSALAAYVQIVNAYCALGKPAEAKTANERAKWLLRRMPPEAFDNGGFTMPKKYWEDWLKWTSDSGVY